MEAFEWFEILYQEERNSVIYVPLLLRVPTLLLPRVKHDFVETRHHSCQSLLVTSHIENRHVIERTYHSGRTGIASASISVDKPKEVSGVGPSYHYFPFPRVLLATRCSHVQEKQIWWGYRHD